MTIGAFLQSRFLRFALVGVGGFIVNEVVLAAMLRGLHLDRYSGQLIAYLVAATFTWWANRQLTFADRAAAGTKSIVAEWIAFLAANALGGLVNYAVYASLVALAPQPFDNPYLAVAAGSIAGLAFNFAMSSRLVFREKK
ncbi:MAG: GtrA family protein [Proteobacteria bacterium]|nr:GtrA family protein [Pseudomonadota bacterium]